MTLKRPLTTSALTLALVTAGASASSAATIGAADLPTEPRAAAVAAAEPATPVLRDLADPLGLKVGVAVDTDRLGSNEAYADLVNTQFSSVTAENVMKWQLLEPTRGTYEWEAADELVASAKANGQVVRGHTLVWHSQLPEWISPDGYTTTLSNAELRAVLKKHVQDTVTHFKGDIDAWDVVNEAINEDGTARESVWYKAFGGTGYIDAAFRWAHEADPDVKLYYNDYNMEFTGPKSDAAHAYAQRMIARGVPVDGVGFQTHLSTRYGFPDLLANLQRFAALGLDIAETEVDVRTAVLAEGAEQGEDGAAQADPDAAEGADVDGTPEPADVTPDADEPVPAVYTSTPANRLGGVAQQQYWSDALSACLLVERCVSFTVWGVSDADSWIPGVFPGEGAALLFDDDYAPKPEFFTIARTMRLAAGAPERG